MFDDAGGAPGASLRAERVGRFVVFAAIGRETGYLVGSLRRTSRTIGCTTCLC
jgi:hypothetical protein